MKYAWAVAVTVVLACLIAPRTADSCGPMFSTLAFTTQRALPGEFKSGRLGVVRPQYPGTDLLLSYRALSGVPMEDSEVTTPSNQGPPPADRAAAWLNARKEITAVPAPASIEPDKKVPGSEYQSFPNCLGPAFDAAAATLRKRLSQWGADSPEIAAWVRGQDQVFENCSGGPAIPQELTATDPLLAADRRYQIASASFYAGMYEDAEARFDRIAADASSPWHEIAPYLAARACIRRNTMDQAEGKMLRAAERLQAILRDPQQKQMHAAAQSLLDFVRARTEPQQRLVELGNELMKPGLGPRLGNVLGDYSYIWRHREAAPPKAPAAGSDLVEWMKTFESGEPAVEQWKARQTLPWLIAALTTTAPTDPAFAELIAAARAVPPSSPAYASVTCWGIRRQVEAGSLDDARRWADQALANQPNDSVVNLLRGERLGLARDWQEFLRFAARKPVATSIDDYDVPLSDAEAKRNPVAFDFDAANPLNYSVPLSLWIDATKNSLLPRNLQADLAQAGWVRAIILNDQPSARTLAGRLQQLQPALAAEMSAYLAEQDPAAAQFRAVFLMLRAPGLEPRVRRGGRRDAPIMEREYFRDNWWNLADHPPQDSSPGPLMFLPKAESAAGEEQWVRISDRAANSVNYLASQAIAWARQHPQDPRVPQALHQVVEATHYGPADGQKSREFSKQAFDILHRRYPASQWTAKTKYWY